MNDFTEEVEKIRERIKEVRKSGTQTISRMEIEEFVRQSFSLTYEDKWRI